MTCTLTIHFSIPGYQDGTDVASYTVVDGSYGSPYIVPRPDLGYDGSTNNVYTIKCDGSAGQVELATYYPGHYKPTISNSENSCPAPTLKYDCINKACLPASKYGTPGFYTSLERCQIDCGVNGCSGQCISNSDWAQIEGLATEIKSKECG